MTSFNVQTGDREEMTDITPQVAAVVAASGVQDGMVLVYCPHTTAAVFINEGADPDVCSDLTRALAAMVPGNVHWKHGEGNSPAHLRSILVGASVTVPLAGGLLALGTWQRIFLAEFDGPRPRHVMVQTIKV